MAFAPLRGRRDDRGAAAVEFALVAPILLTLLFGIISYGYMLSFRQAISQAAAEGARAAAVAPPAVPATSASGDSVQGRALAAVNQGLGSYGVTCTAGGDLEHDGEDAGTCGVAFNACSGSISGAECAKVTLSYTYEDDSLLPIVPGLGVVLPEELSYTAEIEVS